MGSGIRGALSEDAFLESLELGRDERARSICVSPLRIRAIARSKRAISADTALRLGRFFDTSPQFWMNLQARYDLETAEDELDDRLDDEVRTFDEVA